MFLDDKNNKISDNNDILMTERNMEYSTLENESRFVYFGSSVLSSEPPFVSSPELPEPSSMSPTVMVSFFCIVFFFYEFF